LEEDGKKIARKGERPVHFGVVQAAATAPPAPQLGQTSKTRRKLDSRRIIQLDKYETAPNFIQLTQNLTSNL
jgi:hypothetical protein